MKNRSRLAILAGALLLGSASVILVADAADLASAPSPAPAAAQQEQTGEQTDATGSQSGSQAEDATDATEPAGAQVGHQDVPGTPDQTGDNQD